VTPERKKALFEAALKAVLVLVALGAATTAVVQIQGYTYVYGNVAVSVPQVQALLEKGLFEHDICHKSVLSASPRIYVNGLAALTAKAHGGDIPFAYLFWFTLSIASYVAGMLRLGTALGGRVAGALLAFFGLAAIRATIGSTDLIHPDRHFEPATLAMGIGIWGIYAAFRGRWVLGYALLGVASLFQFLVGFLPGALLAPVVLFIAYRERAPKKLMPFVPFGIGLAATYVPMALAGATGAAKVSNRAFVFLYAHVRNPHHVAPSAWPRVAWEELLLFSLAGVALIFAMKAVSKLQRGMLLTLIGGTWLALLANYLFVDVWPIAFVAKLQLARCTPFAKLAVIVGLSVAIADQVRRRDFGLAVLLAFGVLAPFPAWYLVAVSAAALNASRGPERSPRSVRIVTGVLAAVGCLYLLGSDGRVIAEKADAFEKIAGPRFVGGPLLALMLAAPLGVDWLLGFKHRIWRWAGPVLLAGASVWVAFTLSERPKAIAKHMTRGVRKTWPPGNDLERLARDLSEKTPLDALVLVPPAFESFQIHAKRAAVVTFKCIPLSEPDLVEWGDRMGAVLNTKVGIQTSWRGDLDGPYYRRPAPEIIGVAQQYHARYLLTRVGAHGGVNAPIVAQRGAWVVYDVGG